jgi:hypothetical protein
MQRFWLCCAPVGVSIIMEMLKVLSLFKKSFRKLHLFPSLDVSKEHFVYVWTR